MPSLLPLLLLALSLTLALAGNLLSMPVLTPDKIETSSFQDEVRALAAKFGSAKLTFDAIVETKL